MGFAIDIGKSALGIETDAEKAARKAGELQAEGQELNVAEQRRQFDVTQGNLQPFQEAGVAALGQQQALLGLSGTEAQQSAFDQFNQSPGQQFLQDRAQKNLLRNSAAIGGLGGGNVRSALVQQGVGFAQQDFQNQFGRLGQLAGQGQAAVTNLGQFGSQAASNIGQGLVGSSQARASGILGAQQANAQQQQQLIGLGAAFLSDERLKHDIIKIDEDESGGIYRFKYIGDTVEFIGRMAQELFKTRPDAVSVHPSGYLQVSQEFKPTRVL